MLDFKGRDGKFAWPTRLKPREQEDFATWWARHQRMLAHLEPRILEQRVYRHWRLAGFQFIPLSTLKWRLERWPTERILSEVRWARGGTYDPAAGVKAFKKNNPTVRPFDATGTWDYPIVVLETPFGASLDRGVFPDVRYLQVEGHNRFRYLSVLTYQQVKTGPHEVFVLESPITAG